MNVYVLIYKQDTYDTDSFNKVAAFTDYTRALDYLQLYENDDEIGDDGDFEIQEITIDEDIGYNAFFNKE
jgi:hypothetical protein